MFALQEIPKDARRRELEDAFRARPPSHRFSALCSFHPPSRKGASSAFAPSRRSELRSSPEVVCVSASDEADASAKHAALLAKALEKRQTTNAALARKEGAAAEGVSAAEGLMENPELRLFLCAGVCALEVCAEVRDRTVDAFCSDELQKAAAVQVSQALASSTYR